MCETRRDCAAPAAAVCLRSGLITLLSVRAGPLEPLLYPASVSVVVPCYNCAEFVLLALESFERAFDLLHDLVLRRGTRPVECEVVIVDDKSSDSSVVNEKMTRH